MRLDDDKAVQSGAERLDKQRPCIEPLPRAAPAVVADQSRLSIGEAREKQRTLHRRSSHDRPIGDLLPVWGDRRKPTIGDIPTDHRVDSALQLSDMQFPAYRPRRKIR